MEGTLQITQHCAERYAERIMDRDSRSDIAVYVAQHKEKIETDINKLYEFSTLIYTGTLRDKNFVNVFVNGTWVLLADKDLKKAITMYKIEFGLGEEFNKDFVNRMMEKIDESRNAYCEVLKKTEEQKTEYQKIAKEFSEKANEYRRQAKNLDKQVEGYNEIIANMDVNAEEAAEIYRQNVMLLVCKKEF